MIELRPQCPNIFTPISFHLDSAPSYHISLLTQTWGQVQKQDMSPKKPGPPIPVFTPQLHELRKICDSQLLPSLILLLSHWPLIFAWPASSALNWLFCLLSHPLLIHLHTVSQVERKPDHTVYCLKPAGSYQTLQKGVLPS